MLFTLKKIIGGLLMPLPFTLALMGFSLVLLWCTRWQKSGKTIFSLSWLLLLLMSLQPVADRLLLPLESKYATYRGQQQVDYIVVLGGGSSFNPDWAPSSRLSHSSLARVTEGIRLYLTHPGAKIVFTGYGGTDPQSNAKAAALVAESLGVPASDMLLFEQPKDTEQEAEQVAALVGQRPFLLVTSANHLPRAMRFFTTQGLHPIPAPANQLVITTPLPLWQRVLPNTEFLQHSQLMWHETLGSIWQRLTASRKQTTAPEYSNTPVHHVGKG